MRNELVLLSSVLAASLAAACLFQLHQSAAQKRELASWRGQAQVQSQQLEDLQEAQQRSERQRRELKTRAEDLAAELEARPSAPTNSASPAPAPALPPEQAGQPEPAAGGFGKMLASMMKDPDMREMIRNQQRRMADQMYAPLIQRLGMNPEEATQFKDLVTEHMVSAAEKASSMFGSLGSTNATATVKTLSEQQKSFDEQVKTFLGEERYAQYKEYEQTLGERMLLNQFKQQAGSAYNLNEQQTEALLNLMREEKKNLAATTGLPLTDVNKDPANMQALLSEDKVGELLKAQETVGQRVYERARTFLSPEQLETWGKFQTNQLQMMRMGMTMAKKMFGAGTAGSANPVSQ